MTNYTARDFSSHVYASKGKRIALRIDPADADMPWRTFEPGSPYGGNWHSDRHMADDGWTPGYADIVGRAITPQPAKLTAREHLNAALEAAELPADGQVREGESTIHRDSDGRISVVESWSFAPSVRGVYRLLDPRPTRPEGAADMDGKIDAAVRGLDLTTPEGVRALADALATDGVRAAA